MADTSFEPKGGNVKGTPSSEKGTTQGLSGASKGPGNDLDTGRMSNASGSSTLAPGSTPKSGSTAAMSGSGTASGIGGASTARSSSPLVDGDRVLGSHSSTARTGSSSQSEGQQGNARYERGADMLNRLSDRVDDFARERLDMGGIGTRAADYVYGLTDLIDSASRSFQERSPDPFRNELSNKVRRNPVKAVALSLGVGFLVGKLIK